MNNPDSICHNYGNECSHAYKLLKGGLIQRDSLNELINYLDLISGSKKSSDWIFDNIFRTRWNEKEFHNLSIAHINAAKTTLERVVGNHDAEFNPVLIEFLTDLICDLKYWVSILDPEQDFSWLLLNTNKPLSGFYLDKVQELLYGKEFQGRDNSDARFTMAVVMLRHSIEQRIKAIAGIDFIQKGTHQVKLSEIIETLRNLKNLRVKEGVSLAKISKINIFVNHYLHRGLRPYPWQVEWAENEVSKLFYRGETSKPGNYSSNASFETNSLGTLRQEFQEILSLKSPDIRIFWSSTVEVAVVNQFDKNEI